MTRRRYGWWLSLVWSIVLIGATSVLAQTPPVANAPASNSANAAANGARKATVIASTGFLGQMGAAVGCNKTDPSTSLGALVTFFICTLSRYATAIAVLIIMAAGVMYILSGSNPAMAGTAKSIIITTLTGIVAMYTISLVLSILISSGIVSKGPTNTP